MSRWSRLRICIRNVACNLHRYQRGHFIEHTLRCVRDSICLWKLTA